MKKKTRRFILKHFFAGVLEGLGAVIGATLVVSLLLYLLSRLRVVPFLGNFVTEIIKIVQANLNP